MIKPNQIKLIFMFKVKSISNHYFNLDCNEHPVPVVLVRDIIPIRHHSDQTFIPTNRTIRHELRRNRPPTFEGPAPSQSSEHCQEPMGLQTSTIPTRTVCQEWSQELRSEGNVTETEVPSSWIWCAYYSFSSQGPCWELLQGYLA